MSKIAVNLPKGREWFKWPALDLGTQLLLGIIAISLVLNIVVWGLALGLFPKTQEAAVLHYSADLGIDFIGQGTQIMVLPGVGTVIIIINVILGLAVMRAEKRAAWLIWSMLPFIQIVLLGAFYLIWRANQ